MGPDRSEIGLGKGIVGLGEFRREAGGNLKYLSKAVKRAFGVAI
jgi:hypothetical protein